MAKTNGVPARIDPELDEMIKKIKKELDISYRLSSRILARKTKPKFNEEDIKF